jgi:hypothetical protein
MSDDEEPWKRFGHQVAIFIWFVVIAFASAGTVVGVRYVWLLAVGS